MDMGGDKAERLPGLAAELAERNVDVIVTGGTPAAKALGLDISPMVLARADTVIE